MTRLRLNLRFEMPNFPSIALRTLSSSSACNFKSRLTLAGALQALVKHALEPEWEAKFEPNSYGF